MLGATIGALVSLAEPTPPISPCLRETQALIETVQAEPDWLKREVALALLNEARRDATHGREAGCRATLASAREQLAP
jgi:hypothetical protein